MIANEENLKKLLLFVFAVLFALQSSFSINLLFALVGYWGNNRKLLDSVFEHQLLKL